MNNSGVKKSQREVLLYLVILELVISPYFIHPKLFAMIFSSIESIAARLISAEKYFEIGAFCFEVFSLAYHIIIFVFPIIVVCLVIFKKKPNIKVLTVYKFIAIIMYLVYCMYLTYRVSQRISGFPVSLNNTFDIFWGEQQYVFRFIYLTISLVLYLITWIMHNVKKLNL